MAELDKKGVPYRQDTEIGIMIAPRLSPGGRGAVCLAHLSATPLGRDSQVHRQDLHPGKTEVLNM